MGDEVVVVAVAAAAAAAAAAAPARATVRARCLPVQVLLPAGRVYRRLALVGGCVPSHHLPLSPCTALLRAFSSERPAPDNFSQVALRTAFCSMPAIGRGGARAGLVKAACTLNCQHFWQQHSLSRFKHPLGYL